MNKFIGELINKENKKAIAIGVGLGLIGGLLAVNIRYGRTISNLYDLSGNLLQMTITDQKVIMFLNDFIISGKTPTAEQLKSAKEIKEIVSETLKTLNNI